MGTRMGQGWNSFVSKWSRIFQISLLIWTFKTPKMKFQTEEFKKMTVEELEKIKYDQKSVNTCHSTKFAQRLTDHGNWWKNNAVFRTNLGTVNT